MTYVPTVGDIVGDGSSDDDDNELDRTVVEDGSVCHKIETTQYHINTCNEPRCNATAAGVPTASAIKCTQYTIHENAVVCHK